MLSGGATSTGIDARLGNGYGPRPPKARELCPKISKTIERYLNQIHRNPEGLEKVDFSGEILYFLPFGFFRCFLHTVGVTGSNPVSPTNFFSITQVSRSFRSMADTWNRLPKSKAESRGLSPFVRGVYNAGRLRWWPVAS